MPSSLPVELQERIADADEAHVRLRYQCSPYHTNSALHPIIEHLERAARFGTSDSTDAKLNKLETLVSLSGQPVEGAAPLIASLLSLPTEDRYKPTNISPRRQKELTLSALVDQLTGLAELEPLLFVFEDAHWIDPTSLELLDLAVERVPEIATLMVITYRPEFAASWIGRPHVTPIILNRLERRNCALIVERLAGQENLPEYLLNRITEQTDGVPLFVEELTKSVLGSSQGAESIRVDLVPVTLQDSLEARLDRLGPAKEIAQIGSVIGREFRYDLLRSAAELNDGRLIDGLNQLTSSELLYARGQPPDATYSTQTAQFRTSRF
jgi:predicted ATPase